MYIDSGFKMVDQLVQVHGLTCFDADNPFQLSVEIAKDTTLYELRHVLSPFGLRDFPATMWLTLQKLVPTQTTLSLHRFTLPHSHQILCWVLVDEYGKVVERAFPLNRPKYTHAAKVLIGSLLTGLGRGSLQYN